MILRQLTFSVIFLLSLPLVWGTAVVGTWAADRELPVSVVSIKPLPPEPKPGERLQISVSVFRSRSCATHVDRYIMDSEGRKEFLPDVDTREAPGDVGDPEPVINTVSIPVFFKPGPAKYVSMAQYSCNPTHWVFPLRSVPLTMPFTIGASI